MRYAQRLLVALLLSLTTACGTGSGAADEPKEPEVLHSYVVVANRAGGTLTIIDSVDLSVVDTVSLPAATNPATPGYVSYSEIRDELYVGDDANDRIVVLSGRDFTHIADLPAVSDVFHIWHNNVQLWAVDRADRSVAVFDLETRARISVIPMPAELVSAGGIPHDVVVDANHAFVSIAGIEEAPDVVVRYSTAARTETGRMNVGDDPHLFLHPSTSRLYVACQESDAAYVFDRETLVEEDVIPVDGGHGVWIPPSGERLYVTNFAGHEVGPSDPRGAFALFTIDLATNAVIDSTHAQFSAPHNITSTADGRLLFVTHSNGDTNVTVYRVARSNAPPRQLATIQAGANPFGICRIR